MKLVVKRPDDGKKLMFYSTLISLRRLFKIYLFCCTNTCVKNLSAAL